MTILFKQFNRRQSRILLALVLPILAVSMMFLISQTEAAPEKAIAVNSIVDIVADDGQCTLREAITAANSDTASGVSSGECVAGNGDDTIVLSSESYMLTLAGTEEELNATGDLDITSNISLNTISDTATIDANQLDRVLHIHPTVTVTITNIIITGGKTPDGIDGADGSLNNPHGENGGDSDDGGGIYNAGVLTLINSTISNNATGHGGDGGLGALNDEDGGNGGNGGKSGRGGGIYSTGTLALLHSTLIHNHTSRGGWGGCAYGPSPYDGNGGNGGQSGDGGGIYTTESLTLSHSTLSDNSTGHGGPGLYCGWGEGTGGSGGKSGHGGGIYTIKPLNISHSTLSDNATGHGGEGSGGGDGNDSGDGGGIYSIDVSHLTLFSTELSGNSTGNGGRAQDVQFYGFVEGGNAGDGGGIYHAGTGHLSISDSTINNNITGHGGSAPINGMGEGLLGEGGSGGGLFTTGHATMKNSVINENMSGYGHGGGIATHEMMSVSNSIISHNRTVDKDCSDSLGNNGGGVYNTGNLVILNSMISNNRTGQNPDCNFIAYHYYGKGFGGGIHNTDSGELTLSGSIIRGNSTGSGGCTFIYSRSRAENRRGALSDDHYRHVDGGYGGGISNFGRLTITRSTISDNMTGNGTNLDNNGCQENKAGRGGNGGGIANLGTLTLTESTISRNITGHGGDNLKSACNLYNLSCKAGDGGLGGGLYSAKIGDQAYFPQATIINSTIRDNKTGIRGTSNENSEDGVDGDGGGIFGTHLTLEHSTVNNNHANGHGGGIFGSQMTVTNSTLANNYAMGNGGGISGTLMTLNSSTIADNQANGNGGGVFATQNRLKNTILASNQASGVSSDCVGELISEGYNLVQDITNCDISGDLTGNLISIDPLLLPLADYGGTTLTQGISPNSPARDAGSCPDLTSDQRLKPRPIDSSSPPHADDSCDIGAFEVQSIEFHLSKAVNNPIPVAGERITYTITVQNFGISSTITNATVSDTLPMGLTFAGPVTLNAPQAGVTVAQNVNELPFIANGLTISPGVSISLTVPFTVNTDLALGTLITNTVAVTSSQIPTPTKRSQTISLPAPDVALEQTLNIPPPLYPWEPPVKFLPREPLTYTLTFRNAGNVPVTNAVLSNILPLTNVTITSSGAPITDTGTEPPYVWQIADLVPGAGGTITMTGVISPNLLSDVVLTNRAMITATDDIDLTNNNAEDVLTVTVPSIRVSSSSYYEYSQYSSFQVSVYPSTPYTDITVDYTTEDGSATAFEDYIPISGTVMITAGHSSVRLPVTIIDDNIDEPDETFFFRLSNPSGAPLSTYYTTTLTIRDNDTPTPTPTPTSTSTPTNTPTSTPTVTATPTSVVSEHLLYLPLVRR